MPGVHPSGTTLILLLAALLLAAVFFNPRLVKWHFWQATVTPLASIIGSGFLVAGPILAHTAGTQAWLAMLGLCAVAWLFGAALRYNIVHVEPMIAGDVPAPALTKGLERASELSLSLAYFVSVAYYLNLFAAFGLRIDGIVDPFWIRVASTAAIAAIGLVGVLRGLSGLERLEIAAVGLKLSLIGGLFDCVGIVSRFRCIGHRFVGWQFYRVCHGVFGCIVAAAAGGKRQHRGRSKGDQGKFLHESDLLDV